MQANVKSGESRNEKSQRSGKRKIAWIVGRIVGRRATVRGIRPRDVRAVVHVIGSVVLRTNSVQKCCESVRSRRFGVSSFVQVTENAIRSNVRRVAGSIRKAAWGRSRYQTQGLSCTSHVQVDISATSRAYVHELGLLLIRVFVS